MNTAETKTNPNASEDTMANTNTANYFWNLIRGGASREEAWIATRAGGVGQYTKSYNCGDNLTCRRWESKDGSLALDLIVNRDGNTQAINCVRG